MLTKQDTLTEQGIGKRRNKGKIVHIAVVERKLIDAGLLSIQSQCVVGITSPGSGINLEAIHIFAASQRVGKIQASSEQLRTFSQIHQRPIEVLASLKSRLPAIPDVYRPRGFPAQYLWMLWLAGSCGLRRRICRLRGLLGGQRAAAQRDQLRKKEELAHPTTDFLGL